MKFYLVEIITFSDETKDSVSIYPKDTKEEAISRAHTELGGWMIKPNVATVSVEVRDEIGRIYMNDFADNRTE